MKKVLFLFAFLLSVGSYSLSPAPDVRNDDVGITIQKEDVKVADVNIDLQSIELKVNSAKAVINIFSSASLDLNSVSTITRFNYKGPMLLITNGIYKKVPTVPGLVFKQLKKKKSNRIIVSAGGLSEL